MCIFAPNCCVVEESPTVEAVQKIHRSIAQADDHAFPQGHYR